MVMDRSYLAAVAAGASDRSAENGDRQATPTVS
jgi:hypothetical protein